MFKKLLLLLPLAALLTTGVKAQFRYTFKDTTTAYVPLPANAISVNGTYIWTGNNYQLPMPFAWSLDSAARKSVLNLDLGLFGVFNDPSNNPHPYSLTGFTMARSIFVDRGYGDTVNPVSRSPIRYLTVGTTPNRIFKVEIANVGFLPEFDFYGTLDDSVSQQIWIYEGSSIVEMHYGPSKITYFNEYFDLGGTGSVSLNIGLIKDVVYLSSGSIYYLSGPPTSLTVKSALLFPTAEPTDGLTTWPSNGTVYRFTPKVDPAGIADLATLGNMKVYPNPATNSVTIEGASAGTRAVLYSMLGQPVLQATLSGKQALDIAALPAGIYKLVLTDKDGVSGAATVVKQ